MELQDGEELGYEEKKEIVLENINREDAFRDNKKYVLIIDEIIEETYLKFLVSL